MDFECRGWPPQPQIFIVVAVLRSPKNAQFWTSALRCWRLCRLSSAFKIHSKGCKSHGEALWLCCRLFFLCIYWFSDKKKVINLGITYADRHRIGIPNQRFQHVPLPWESTPIIGVLEIVFLQFLIQQWLQKSSCHHLLYIGGVFEDNSWRRERDANPRQYWKTYWRSCPLGHCDAVLVFWHFWLLEKTISEMRHPVYIIYLIYFFNCPRFSEL